LLEGAVYDSDGQLVSGSFMDYAMPHAENFPSASRAVARPGRLPRPRR
jgi:carbon-monoxide dehydrogenase large subunit